MSDDHPDLTAFQLADSFLPVGGYSSSYALEQFVADGTVSDAEDLEPVLAAYLRRQVGPCDLVALRAANGAALDEDAADLVRIDERLHATTLQREFRESATRSGARLCDLWLATREAPVLSDYVARDPPGHYPVVLGVVAATAGIDAERACRLHCHAFCSDMLGAAQRLCSFGHTAAQRVLVDLQPVMAEAVETSADRTVAEMRSFAPLIDVAAARHERADRRLFVS